MPLPGLFDVDGSRIARWCAPRDARWDGRALGTIVVLLWRSRLRDLRHPALCGIL